MLLLMNVHALLLAVLDAPPASVPDPRLQRLLFDPPKPGPSGRDERRWLGADCATSLSMPGNATMWLFGDTLVSGFGGGARNLSGCAMPHQSVALQREPGAALDFVWREGADGPLNMFRPSNASMERAVACASPFSETTPYYWVVAGIESGAAGLAPGRLLLLAQRIVGTPGQGLGFAVLGSTAIVVDNAADDPARWVHRSADLTTCTDADSCEMWSAGAAPAPAGACLEGGVACVYLVGGVGSAAAGQGQALMRGPLGALLDLRFDALEILGADGTWRRRSPGSSAPGNATRAAPLFPQQSELSLHFHAPLGRWLAASFDGFGGQRLLLWSTPGADVRGPWGSVVAHTLGPPWNDTSRYFAYAAKLHPHLAARPDEMVLTYVANAWDMDELFAAGETMIYTPQVLRANLTLLLTSPSLANGARFSAEAPPDVLGGWPPIDAQGVHRHAALGLFDSTLTPVQATVAKSARNPLFGQDKPWETRIDNGYPNVVYDPESAHLRGDGPWRLWYGNIGGDGGSQFLLYANSTDGLAWDKPDLDRYDLHTRWTHDPNVAKYGKHNNVIMAGGGLGIYHDQHEPNASLRYKISGGAPPGCYASDGNENCVAGTAGSPDGIGAWSDVLPLGFPAPWRPDCHTNLFYDEPLQQYLMTTRSYEDPDGRLVSLARTGSGNRTVFVKNGTWDTMYTNEYPPTRETSPCFKTGTSGATDEADCSGACLKTPGCRYFWTYTSGSAAGNCCMKSSIEPGNMSKPACTTCDGIFGRMGGHDVVVNGSAFDSWEDPAIIERGTAGHQLYSQITWRFYDIFLGIVMTFDAADKAGHVHCMLSWSPDSRTWHWVDPAGLESLKEFIPAGADGSFDSHVCFAAHMPLKMADGSSRVYYMGGDGPHSGARKSSFALATLPPDRFAGLTSADGGDARTSTAVSRAVLIAGAQLLVTADVAPGGSVRLGVLGSDDFQHSVPLTVTGTDVPVHFDRQPAGLAPLVGQHLNLTVTLDRATLYTIGFKKA